MTYRVAGLISICAAVFNAVYMQAYAAEVPIRKPGQWKLSTVSETTGLQTFETCITGKDSIVAGDDNECGKPDVKRIDDEIFVNVACKSETSSRKISTLLTGDFSSWYRAVTKITFNPPQDGVSHLGVIVDGKYLGPTCRADSQGPAKQQK